MYNLLIALAVGIAVALGVRLAGFQWWAGLIPGTVAMLATYIVLARRIANRIQAIVTQAQQELSAQPANKREQQQRVDRAIKIIESGLPYGRWQFLIASELHSQIAMIKYMMRDYEGAKASFARSNPRNYMALALQASLAYQEKRPADMERLFEAAVKAGKKEGIVWAAYAWCLQQLKEKEKALRVMARAVEINPSDEKLKAGLTALQNDKKLKMKAYEPLWWQFGLETPPQMVPGGRQTRFVRG